MFGWTTARRRPSTIISNEGLSDSEAVRTALREAAARRRARSAIVAEVERLAADDADRAEMRAVREEMAELGTRLDRLKWCAVSVFPAALSTRSASASSAALDMR